MKIGLFYIMQVPRPWSAVSERDVFVQAVEQVALADRLGFDQVWTAEHHFLEEYSHGSAPELFLAACSQRTRRMRLGHGIVQLPPTVNHPARIAERIGVLDILSGGRVDFGTGEGSSDPELGGFGTPPEAKREMWHEALDVIVRMMTEAPFRGHAGRYITVPERNVLPKPVQYPHPPLWMACSNPDSIQLAARKGLGALCFTLTAEPDRVRAWVEDYYAAVASEECFPAGERLDPQIAACSFMYCHADERTAVERSLDGAHFTAYGLRHYYGRRPHEHGRTDLWAEFQRNRVAAGLDPELAGRSLPELRARVVDGDRKAMRGAIGTPEQIRRFLRRYEEAGVDQLLFNVQAGMMSHEHICESLELFAAEVLPEFAERDAEQRARRLHGIRPSIDAALARRASRVAA